MASAHLLPEDFNPYNALRKIRMYPSRPSNSGPFSSVNASRYALPCQLWLLSLPRNITSLQLEGSILAGGGSAESNCFIFQIIQ